MKNKKISINKYQPKIDAELDLHGLTQREAEGEVWDFLSEAEEKEYLKVRIITGKGLHSENGEGVLKSLVIGILRQKGLE